MSVMLHALIATHRTELIDRCRRKSGAAGQSVSSENGVPLFLDQLVETLQAEPVTNVPGSEQTRSRSEIGRTAGLRGAQLLQHGYTVDEVVHEYGNVCQAVTELAIETSALISNQEFRTLNRCLDDAISDAVTAYARVGKELILDRQNDLHARLDSFADEHHRLIDVAAHAFSAIKSGNVGATGATGLLLAHTLSELRELVSRTIPEEHRG
jgi:hypothetical protein